MRQKVGIFLSLVTRNRWAVNGSGLAVIWADAGIDLGHVRHDLDLPA